MYKIDVTNFDNLSKDQAESLGYEQHLERNMRLIYGYVFEKKIPAQLLPRIFEMGLASYATLQCSVKALPELFACDNCSKTKRVATHSKIIFPEQCQL